MMATTIQGFRVSVVAWAEEDPQLIVSKRPPVGKKPGQWPRPCIQAGQSCHRSDRDLTFPEISSTLSN